ncbi:MAG: ARMT1-like domain-containing protein [Veillonellales bacterium]
MGSHVDCIACIVNKANNLADLYIKDKRKKYGFMQAVLTEILHTGYDRSAPLVEAKMTRIARQVTGIEDFYEHDKRYFNDLLLSLEQDVETLICKGEEPLVEALKAALAGNIIDFSALNNVPPDLVKDIIFKTVTEQELDSCTYERLLDDLACSTNLLYLGDNAGEIVLDKILLKYIKRRFPHLNIVFTTRGTPISSDVTEKDAYYVGIDQYAAIVNNGTDLPGTDLQEVSDVFKDAFEAAEVIIAKGQGNFETLTDSGKNIYYLFLCKCNVFVKKLNFGRFTPIFQAERKSQKGR